MLQKTDGWQRRIAGAGLDAFSAEPPPPDHPLLRLDNTMLGRSP